MTAKGIAVRFGDARLFLSLTVTVMLCFSLIVCSPDKGYCLGEFEQYAFPGVWAQDIPRGWLNKDGV